MRPQQLGRIKIGGLGKKMKGKNGKPDWQMPVKYEHFVVTGMSRGDDGNFDRDEGIHEIVGEEPTILTGTLMFDTVEENLHTEMVQYKGRGADGKIWSCDGEEAINLKSGKVGDCIKAAGGECACKPYARFHIQLDGAPALGYHFFRTTSWESTNNIQTALEEIYSHCGTCFHAPVQLVCYPSIDQHEGKTSTSHKVGLRLTMSWRELATTIGEARKYLDIARGEVKELASATHNELAAQDAEEQISIADEFFPPEEGEVLREVIADALDADDEDGDEGPDHEVWEEEEYEDPDREAWEGDEDEESASDENPPALEL